MVRVLIRCLCFAFCVLVLPATADVDDLLRWQRRGDSGAYVSSGFNDWRGVSKYRSRPGLHAGYDIAMVAGSPVRTPWPGTVVAVTPWYGAEVGVTVRLSNGYEATFGHITAVKRLGEAVNPGDILGYVVVDHVDVKMRDARGIFADFGAYPIAGLDAAPSLTTARTEIPDPKTKKAARDAYFAYDREIAKLDKEEELVRLGLLAPKKAEATRSHLDTLRRLANLHVQLTGEKLPKRRAADDDATPPDSVRPVTDSLLKVGEP